MNILGINSGTSIDSLDIALFECKENKINFIQGVEVKYPNVLKEEIKSLGPNSSILNCDKTSINLGKFVGMKTNSFLKSNKLKASLIGMHGQTIHHSNEVNKTTTIQITEADLVSDITGIDVVHDFRKKDVINGGSGAPLVPILDFYLFTNIKRPFICQNLGGIANTTLVHKTFKQSIGYDSGPANSILDKIIYIHSQGKKSFDKNGELASKGAVNSELLEKMLNNSYFRRRPPKSTGNREFGIEYVLDLLAYAEQKKINLNDLLATATELTVESIARSYEQFIFKKNNIETVVLSGGGIKNGFMISSLERRLPKLNFKFSDESGMPSKYKECALFALLAYHRVKNKKVNLINITGSNKEIVLGKISYK